MLAVELDDGVVAALGGELEGSPEVAAKVRLSGDLLVASEVEGVLDGGHVNSSKCLRQNHCGARGQPTAVKASADPHTEQGWSPG